VVCILNRECRWFAVKVIILTLKHAGRIAVSIRIEVPLIRASNGESVSALLVTLTQKHLDDFDAF
jgi:hypothetical protein